MLATNFFSLSSCVCMCVSSGCRSIKLVLAKGGKIVSKFDRINYVVRFYHNIQSFHSFVNGFLLLYRKKCARSKSNNMQI